MLDNLLDYIPDGVFTVDAEWRVTFFNRAAEQITGISAPRQWAGAVVTCSGRASASTDALRRNGGNHQKAAKELGINPSTLFRKVKILKGASGG